MSGFAINRSLARRDFPFTLYARRSDNHRIVWAVTILPPPGSALLPVYVPPLAKWEGVPIDMESVTAEGVRTFTPWRE